MSWKRSLIRAGWIGGGVLVTLGFAAWLGGLVVQASFLRVRTIRPAGYVQLTEADVTGLIHDLKGEPLLAVDLEKYRQLLLASPWIATAEIWRELPSGVRVRITERTPLAIARFDTQLYLVDAEGVVLDRFGQKYASFNLPVVDGLPAAEIGGRVDAARIGLVDRLFQELSARSDLFERLSQVDVSSPRNAIVTLRGETARLYLGDEGFIEKLERWMQSATNVREKFVIEDHVDLRYGTVIFGK